eukprot:8915775-Pyramimonas_sp.AAC.1
MLYRWPFWFKSTWVKHRLLNAAANNKQLDWLRLHKLWALQSYGVRSGRWFGSCAAGIVMLMMMTCPLNHVSREITRYVFGIPFDVPLSTILQARVD